MEDKRNNAIYDDYRVCRTYDKVRSGEYKNFSPHFFSGYDKHKKIIIIMKYYVEDILRITPEEALYDLTLSQLEEDKLKILLRHIKNDKPDEYKRDPEYIKHLVYLAYPELAKPTEKDLVIQCYKEVLSGRRKTFPKNYFKSVEGEQRAKICFEYLWKDVLQIKKEEIPLKFLQSNGQGLDVLQEYKLKILTQMIYYSVSDMIQNIYPDLDISKVTYREE